ncbi:general transcription factor 3C polypeptide 3-like protein, partial [Leptotrombidium deliense]
TEKQWETYKLLKTACGDLVCDALDFQSDSSSEEEQGEVSAVNSPQPCSSKSVIEDVQDLRTQFSDLDTNEEKHNLTRKYIDGQLSFDELASHMKKKQKKVVPDESDQQMEEVENDTEIENEVADESSDPEWRHDNELEELIVDHEINRSKKRRKSARQSGVRIRRRLPRDLMGLVGEANLCFARGQHEDAIRMCLEVKRLAPTAPEPFQTLGMLYEEMEDMEKAFQYHLIAAYLCPSDGDNWIKVAEMAVKLKHFQQAITCYSHAIKIFPTNIELLWQRCKLHENLGDLKKALDGYESILKALKVSDGENGIHLAKDIAKLHFSQANLAASINVMETAMEKYPKNITSEDVNLYVELLIAEKLFIKSLIAFRTYCGVKYSINDEVIDDLNCDSLMEKKEEVCADLPSELFPIDLRAKLIVCLINLNMLRSVSFILQVIRNESAEDMGDLYLDIAEAYLGMEMYSSAEPLLFELIYTQAYNIAAVWLRYARCLKKLNKIEESIAAYYEVVRQAPEHHEAKLELTDLLILMGRHEDATAATGQDESSAVSLDLLLLQCKLLFQQGLWSDFVVAAELFLRNDMYYLTHDKEISAMINSQSHRNVHKELGIRDTRELMFTGNTVSVNDTMDIFFKLCFVLNDKLQNYKELIRVVFSAFTSSLLRENQDTLDYCALTAVYLTRNLNHCYPLMKMVISRNLRNNQVWNLFCVMMMRYYQDLRHNRFCLRLFIKNPDIQALAYFNGHNALMSGSYKHALAEYVNIHRNDANDPLAILCISIGFSHIACQKFITSRHSVLIQLCAFLNMYLQLRGECQESYYNVGRAFHQLGLVNEAVHFYKRALNCVQHIEVSNEEDAENIFDLKKETAFNLALIYQNSGANDLALHYLRRFVVV